MIINVSTSTEINYSTAGTIHKISNYKYKVKT